MSYRPFVIVVVFFLLFGCDRYPVDPEGSLDHITDANLHVGIVHNPPFVRINENDTSGLEVDLVRTYAKKKNAKIIWIAKSESSLVERLKNYEIHILISGLTATSPLSKEVGSTSAYYRKHIVALPRGENAFLCDFQSYLNSQEEFIKDFMLTHGRKK